MKQIRSIIHKNIITIIYVIYTSVALQNALKTKLMLLNINNNHSYSVIIDKYSVNNV